MQLPAFLKREHKESKQKQYLFALLLTQDYISAALWMLKGDTVDILSKATVIFTGKWKEIIAASDRVLSMVTDSLSDDVDIEKVIFGISPQYVKNDQIVESQLKELKQLCKELGLSPAGFVVVPEAIAYFMAKREGSPLTAILVGVEQKSLTITLFKVGKAVGTTTVPRSSNVAKDVEEALSTFEEVKILPSKILLYDGEKDLNNLREDLLNHPWQKKSSFLHFPKVELFDKDLPIEAVAVAGASEIDALKGPMAVVDETKQEIEQFPEEAEPDLEKKTVKDEVQENEKHEDDVVNASTVGFVQGADVAKINEKSETDRARPHMEVVVTEEENKKQKTTKKPRITIPSISIKSMFSRLRSNIRFLIAIGSVGLFLLGGAVVSVYWTVPKATVTVLVDPKIFRRDVTVILDPDAKTSDLSEKRIPVQTVEANAQGSKTIETTGKKITGEYAKGTVTIYNKTTSKKTFPKKTTLVGPKRLLFTLDKEITVASTSDVIVGTPGKQNASIVAASIGSESNLPAGSDFSFKELPVTSYAARNESALTGGSSREVQAVSKEDRVELLSQIKKELIDKAKTQINQNIQTGQQLLKGTLDVALTDQEFSHEIGAETSEITLSATARAKGLVYQQEDILTLAEQSFNDTIPDSYTLDKQSLTITVQNIKTDKKNNKSMVATIKALLMPKISVESIKKDLVGKNLSDVQTYLQGIKGIVGYEVTYTKKLPFIERFLPMMQSNLTVMVEPR